MTRFPLVSIIIPCYNAAPRLRACLESCLEQSYSNLEILFVDNCSTDQSREIARQIAATTTRPLHLFDCAQKGANYARSYGFQQARGEYIQWLDADDELAPDKIARQVVALEAQPLYQIACADWEWHYYQNGQCRFQLGFSALCSDDFLLQCLLHHWHPPHAYLLRHAVAQRLHELEAWYPGAAIGNDREYFTTAAIIGCRFLKVPGATVRYYTWSDTQLTCSTSYRVRVESMKQVYERLNERICYRPLRSISGLHWFLLRQSWDLWRLPPIQIKPLGEQCFWLERTDTSTGMTLTLGEARIVLAMSQTGGMATIEDHAYRTLRSLWQQVALQPGVAAATIETELAKWVGLLPDNRPLIAQSSSSMTPEQLRVVATISTIPLYAPMFPGVRLVILQLLEKLRGAGLLQGRRMQSTLPQQALH